MISRVSEACFMTVSSAVADLIAAMIVRAESKRTHREIRHRVHPRRGVPLVLEASSVRTMAGMSSSSTTPNASTVISNTTRFCASDSGKSPSDPITGNNSRLSDVASWRNIGRTKAD